MSTKIDVPPKKTFRLKRDDWTKIGERAGWLRFVREQAIAEMTRGDWEKLGRKNGWTREDSTPISPVFSASLAPVTAAVAPVEAPPSPANRYNFTVKRDASGRICSIEATSLG